MQMRPRGPMRLPGMGVKNMKNRRVRNRRYKIKRILAEPKMLKLSIMVDWFIEWQLEEAQSILAVEEGTTIKNKYWLIKNKH